MVLAPLDLRSSLARQDCGGGYRILRRAAAENNCIGYDQAQRATFWEALSQTPGYDPAKITTPCESDCTCGVATCVKAAEKRKGHFI